MDEQLELFDDDDLKTRGPASTPKSAAPPSTDPEQAEPKVPQVVHPESGPDRFLTRLAVHYATEFELPKLAGRVSVSWNRRMRTAAGRAFYQSDQIELNPKLQELPEERRNIEIFGTFLHELAHLVSYSRAGGRRIQPHGPEWKQACRDLGIPGEDRCHNLDFQPRKMKRRFTYECRACGSIVERVRRIKRAAACYECCKAHSGGAYDDRFRLIEKVIT